MPTTLSTHGQHSPDLLNSLVSYISKCGLSKLLQQCNPRCNEVRKEGRMRKEDECTKDGAHYSCEQTML